MKAVHVTGIAAADKPGVLALSFAKFAGRARELGDALDDTAPDAELSRLAGFILKTDVWPTFADAEAHYWRSGGEARQAILQGLLLAEEHNDDAYNALKRILRGYREGGAPPPLELYEWAADALLRPPRKPGRRHPGTGERKAVLRAMHRTLCTFGGMEPVAARRLLTAMLDTGGDGEPYSESWIRITIGV